jgi:arylsulfatase A-like enzyme
VLEAAGMTNMIDRDTETADRAPVDIDGLTLRRALKESDPEGGIVFTEAYVPDTLIALMETQDPEAIETYRCRQMRRAVYRGEYKLITVGNQPDELFNLAHDPGELVNLISEEQALTAELNSILEDFVFEAEARAPDNWKNNRLRLEEDRELAERLRGLGYLS